MSNFLYILFVNAVSLVMHTMFEIIKGFHTDDVLLSTHFKSFEKNKKHKRKLITKLQMFWMREFCIISFDLCSYHKKIIRIPFSINVMITLSQVN